MNGILKIGSIALLVLTTGGALAADAKKSKKEEAKAPAGPVSFAPMPEGHELASLWNSPEFTKRLVGSYGFDSNVEPRLTPDEQAVYRDKVVPILQEDPKKAITTLEGMVKPNASALFDFTLGNLYFQTEDLTNAVKYFEMAISKFPDFRRAHKNLGFALVRDGKYEAAIKPLLKTVSLGGGDGQIFGILGFAYTSINKPVSAEGAYRQALVFEPENYDLKLGLVKSSIATANYDYALGLLDEMIQSYPDRANLWNLHANIHIQKEQPMLAALSLEMLRRMGKANSQNLFLLGDLYMSQEAKDLALNAYMTAIQQDEGKNVAKALRPAQILVSQGAWDEARTLFATIRTTGGGVTGADELKLLKLEAKVAMTAGDPEQGIKTIEEIVQKDPLDGEALLIAGDYYAKAGEKEKAVFRYETASKVSGFEADAFVKHAQLLVQSQKYNQAVELLRKAQKAKPRDNVQRYLEKVEQLARAGQS
ncbi:MAG: tetratricopeptide repeat protein [Verrucomicrobiota bacterium]|nr:tetratricopeptide repeat protein [Verrucomicrobiota bacterium]